MCYCLLRDIYREREREREREGGREIEIERERGKRERGGEREGGARLVTPVLDNIMLTTCTYTIFYESNIKRHLLFSTRLFHSPFVP